MTGADQLDRFVAALWGTPIPAAPPPKDNRLEVLGLNLLDLALNQQHIGRVSERLTLTDATHLARQVSLEIELAALAPARLAALASDDRAGGGPPQSLWLPLTRLPRRNAGWVDVSDVDGRRIATMSTEQTERALIQGLRKVFEVYFDSAAVGSGTLGQVRTRYHRSRWLIEAAISALIEHGGGEDRPPAPGPAPAGNGSTAIRDKAEVVVRSLFDERRAFPRMLDIAMREHLLVVRVPAEPSQLVLRYDDPGGLETTTDRRRSIFRREFTVRYQTVIPREVDTYEVTVEAPQGIQVRRFLLATRTDRASVRILADDMRATASRYPTLSATADKLLQLELHAIASRLAELGRRRERDLRAFKAYIRDCYASFTSRPPKFPGPYRMEDQDPLRTVTRRVVSQLARFAALYESGEFGGLSKRVLSEAALRRWADELESADLDTSLDFDSDTRDGIGRIRWRRRTFGGDPARGEPVEANVYVSLVDDPISLSSGVSKLVVAVLFLVAAFAMVLQPRLLSGIPVLGALAARIPNGITDANSTMPSADAVVTVLLLVPALLITRTQLPPRSLLGRLLIWPRFVAYASVISMVLLALSVASLPANALWWPFLFVMAILASMLLVVTVDFVTKGMMLRNRVPPYQLIPAWLHREASRLPRRRLRQCVAYFSSTEREEA